MEIWRTQWHNNKNGNLLETDHSTSDPRATEHNEVMLAHV